MQYSVINFLIIYIFVAGIDNLSCDNQILPNSNTTNNLKIRHDTTDINAEDDIEIIHASLAEDVRKKNIMTHNLKSAKCLNDNKSDFDDKMDVSNVESNNEDDVNDRGISKTYIKKYIRITLIKQMHYISQRIQILYIKLIALLNVKVNYK